MKKLIALTLLALLLCGCSNAKEAPAPETQETTAETTVETTQATVPVEPEPDAKAIAASLIDHPVEELYEAIGYPESSDYAPSCLKENGEDGNLYYDGFIVYTIRQGDSETVYYVE